MISPIDHPVETLTTQSLLLGTLAEELRAASPELNDAIERAVQPQLPSERRTHLRNLGTLWFQNGGEPEVLAELGLAICEEYGVDAGVALSELLMAFGAARDEQRVREWESHLMRRMAELRGLHRVISAANSSLDIESSMQEVVQTVAEVMGVEACSVYLFDRNTDDLILRATHGLNDAAVGQVRIAMGEGVTGWAAREGRPVSLRDAWTDTHFHHEPALNEDKFRSILAVPIVLFSAERFHIGADKLQGVISVQTSQPRDFTPDEIDFIETVAGELAFFIVNAQLYQQTGDQLHQKLRELTTLQQVSKHIAEQLQLDKLLKLIAAKAVELAHVDRADILRSSEDFKLELVATHGGNESTGLVLDFLSNAVREGRPLAVLNAYNDSRFPNLAEVAAQEHFCSLFCMPLHVRGQITGAICLYTHNPRHFDYEQVRLLATFADEAAIAIENARLFEESKRALAIKSTMLQEMHHRVRNNLQTISALLTMQQRRLPQNEAGAQALRDSVARIQAIAGVHNLLCREDVGITTVDAVARQIVDSIRVSLVNPEAPVHFEVRGTTTLVGSRDATVLAIVLNELIANAMSHGLAHEGGTLIVETTEQPYEILVEVRDDGPSHIASDRSSSGSGLGLQIIRTLVTEDLEGTFRLFEEDGWMRGQVRFPNIVRQE